MGRLTCWGGGGENVIGLGKICDGIMTLKLEIKHMKILVHNFTSNQHIFPLILFKDQLKKKKIYNAKCCNGIVLHPTGGNISWYILFR